MTERHLFYESRPIWSNRHVGRDVVSCGFDRTVTPKTVESWEGSPPRAYRAGPVETALLPAELVDEMGLTTRLGTVRQEAFMLARAAYVGQVASEHYEGDDVLEYHDGYEAERVEGTFIKSLQGFAEDSWRRLQKRLVPKGNPLDDDDFRAHYERTKKQYRRSATAQEHLVDLGAAVQGNKIERDRHGKRFRLAGALHSAPIRQPLPFVRCTGPEPVLENFRGHIDVGRYLERYVAREEQLHRQFTHAYTARDYRHGRRTANGHAFMQRHAREADGTPWHVSVGRWRQDEICRDDASPSVTVPYLIAEIDAEGETHTEKRTTAFHYARRLVRLLEEKHGVDPRTILCSYSGNTSFHVRIPHGLVGCPIYHDSLQARKRIELFFRRLLIDDPLIFEALDQGCWSPKHLIRTIGSAHEKDTNRLCIGLSGSELLAFPLSYIWELACMQRPYQAFTVHTPHSAAYSSSLASLLTTPPATHEATSFDVYCGTLNSEKPEWEAIIDRIRDGVAESEPWGRDLDYTPASMSMQGRNAAAYWFARDLLRGPDSRGYYRALDELRGWNRFNDPPLRDAELIRCLRSAYQYQYGIPPP